MEKRIVIQMNQIAHIATVFWWSTAMAKSTAKMKAVYGIVPNVRLGEQKGTAFLKTDSHYKTILQQVSTTDTPTYMYPCHAKHSTPTGSPKWVWCVPN
ncbi:hypothetical protein SAY87_019942 [Trapa incisa]|uniref:Uncharacterized protein n=1 Tax=Trapa incisa TaxID=236973 RepID=A0AAN7Q2Z6_9MYRT|nr:hypothetical protein SAY87_019942 [Trapa incisa]